MDAVYDSLAERVRLKWAEKQRLGQKRLVIALAGPPGSGKTTIAKHVVEQIKSSDSGPSIVAIPADGFHLSLATLRALPNATEALARRGAPWTFDGAAVVCLVRQLIDGAGQVPVAAPTFDHAVKDPVENGLVVDADVEVCLLEGNYLLSDEEPWREIAEIVDERWLVTVKRELARQRVAARHVSSGIESTMEDGLRRADGNDLVNGEYVARRSAGRFDVSVESVQETG